MQIHIGSGIGTGPTTMAAFDSALNEVGICNYNLIYLSSIVPPKAEIVPHNGKIDIPMPGQWGDRLYVVMAQKREYKHNVEAWAGIGWIMDKKSGRGLFTEHEGGSEAFVKREIEQTLKALVRNRKQMMDDAEWGPIQMCVTGATCTKEPVCAMVAAVFQASDWDNKAYFITSRSPKTKQPEGQKNRFWQRLSSF